VEATETKRVIIIAGANGAGKTTFARSYLPNEALCIRFVNVDMIASGLSPFAPEIASVKAGRLALQEMDERVECGESFAFETTLSRTGYLKRIKRWRSLGYKIAIHYLFLPSVDIAIARVSERVKHGGHNIPEAVIR
jgi:predicted ABC-type ATPase